MLSEKENPQTASDELLQGLRDEYEMRSQTPYYQKIKDSMAGNSLPRSEILVEISADPEDFEDYGVFYTAPGRISLPVTVSPADYEAVMKNGAGSGNHRERAHRGNGSHEDFRQHRFWRVQALL